uniref:Centromere protein K n=1 Tax=Varanus komodoensis TaxID=61221 RepID=A0A8D2J6I0_VARKO
MWFGMEETYASIEWKPWNSCMKHKQLSLLLMRLKALTVELNQWQKRKPESKDFFSFQLQKLDHDLQMVLSTLNAKNKNLKQNLLRAFQELKSKMLKIKAYKDEISNALGEFLEEHFPLPENHGAAKKKRLLPKEPNVQLITLHEILESLIDRLINVPHDPYITISSSFWSPYIELLLRHGIALRHPEDPNRIRLENFYQ